MGMSILEKAVKGDSNGILCARMVKKNARFRAMPTLAPSMQLAKQDDRPSQGPEKDFFPGAWPIRFFCLSM